MVKDLKFPKELATKLEYNSQSSEPDKNKEAWIMSASKTFCAATAALMAADGKFGDKKINANLRDILNEAELKHPERTEQINKYREMIKEKNQQSLDEIIKKENDLKPDDKDFYKKKASFTKARKMIDDGGWFNITMLELLSHRSGLENGDTYLYQKDPNIDPDLLTKEQKEQFRMEVYSDKLLFSFDPSRQKTSFAYCNLGFVLAEDMINLVADQDYYAELEKRILNPLDLKHTKSIYESEEARKTVSDHVKIKDVPYDWGVPAEKTVRQDCLRNTEKGYIALSEGGLCSTVSDLEKFYGELSKLVCGMENKLQSDPQKIQEIRRYYVEARKLGENLDKKLDRDYSLGLAIEDKGDEGIWLWHRGDHPGNNADAGAMMNINIKDFMNINDSLKTEGVVPKSNVLIKQQDTFAKDSLLTIVSCDYISKINEYFREKCDQSTDEKYKDKWTSYYQYQEAARTWNYVAKDWQNELIEQKRLPENFGGYHDRIREAYKPAQEALNQYVKDHFCDKKGVIDSNKVAEIKNRDDFDKIVEAIKPELDKARDEVFKIFKECDEELAKSNSWVEKLHLGDHHQDQKSFVEQIKDQEHNNKNNDKQH